MELLSIVIVEAPTILFTITIINTRKVLAYMQKMLNKLRKRK